MYALHTKSYVWNTIIDWIVFQAVSAIFQPNNGIDYQLEMISFEVTLTALTSLFSSNSSETVFCVSRGCYPLHGAPLTSHPTDIWHTKLNAQVCTMIVVSMHLFIGTDVFSNWINIVSTLPMFRYLMSKNERESAKSY